MPFEAAFEIIKYSTNQNQIIYCECFSFASIIRSRARAGAIPVCAEGLTTRRDKLQASHRLSDSFGSKPDANREPFSS
jgi:hypothetical protein